MQLGEAHIIAGDVASGPYGISMSLSPRSNAIAQARRLDECNGCSMAGV